MLSPEKEAVKEQASTVLELKNRKILVSTPNDMVLRVSIYIIQIYEIILKLRKGLTAGAGETIPFTFKNILTCF